MRPMERIATSGWLTIGVWKSPPSLPALVTVNVDPRSSSGASVLSRTRSASDVSSAWISSADLRVAAAHDRHHEPLRGLHGDADVVAIEIDDGVAVEPCVQLRELRQRVGRRLDDGRHELLHVDRLEVALLDPGDGGTSRCARAMCSAMTRRTPRSGSRRSPAAVPPEAALRTSSSVIRPAGPVPVTSSMSTPSSCATLRTSGVARGPPGGLGRCRLLDVGGRDRQPPRRSRRARCRRGRSRPRLTKMRDTTPAAGDGISTVALSVWISTSGSSSAIS